MCKKNLKKVFIRFRFYTVKVMILFRYRYYPVTITTLPTITDRYRPFPTVTERYRRYRTFQSVSSVTERYIFYLTKNFK
jgi:hypothetical protein